jgi:hypothetical protein
MVAHTIGQTWVNAHGDMIGSKGASTCADYRGSFLSQVKIAKTFNSEGKPYSLAAGTQVGCYTCRNGSNGD